MKKLLLIFLVISLNQRLVCQAYQPLDTNIVWNTLKTGVGNSCYKDHLCTYFVNGSLINNGLTWHKVYVNIRECTPPGYTNTPTVPCGPPATIATASFIGMFSNDIVNKRVFFVPSATLSANFIPGNNNLLFDFDKVLNDTICTYDSGSPASSIGLTYIVTGIDSILFDGKYHKRFIGSRAYPSSYCPTNDYFIEGVGSSGGIFQALFDVFTEQSNYLICFSGVSSSKYIEGVNFYLGSPTSIIDTIACNFLATGVRSIQNTLNTLIKIYPNPGSGLFHLSIENSEQTQLTAHLSDISSREIRSLNLNGWEKDQQFDISDLNAGIYFLTITRDKDIIYTTLLQMEQQLTELLLHSLRQVHSQLTKSKTILCLVLLFAGISLMKSQSKVYTDIAGDSLWILNKSWLKFSFLDKDKFGKIEFYGSAIYKKENNAFSIKLETYPSDIFRKVKIDSSKNQTGKFILLVHSLDHNKSMENFSFNYINKIGRYTQMDKKEISLTKKQLKKIMCIEVFQAMNGADILRNIYWNCWQQIFQNWKRRKR